MNEAYTHAWRERDRRRAAAVLHARQTLLIVHLYAAFIGKCTEASVVGVVD